MFSTRPEVVQAQSLANLRFTPPHNKCKVKRMFNINNNDAIIFNTFAINNKSSVPVLRNKSFKSCGNFTQVAALWRVKNYSGLRGFTRFLGRNKNESK